MIKISNQAPDINQMILDVKNPNNGAIVVFLGVTRKYTKNREVFRLEYQAYQSMAITEIDKICIKIKDIWGIKDIQVFHRIGVVNIGDVSLAIVLGSAHRSECFDAVRYFVNKLKTTVPIWKKEQFVDGEVWVEGLQAEEGFFV